MNILINSPAITASAWGLLRAYLATQGYSQAWINEVMGNSRGDKRRVDVQYKIKEALRVGEAPK